MTYRIYVNGRPVRKTVTNPDSTITISLPATDLLQETSVSFTINEAVSRALPGIAVDTVSGVVYVNLIQPAKGVPTPIVTEEVPAQNGIQNPAMSRETYSENPLSDSDDARRTDIYRDEVEHRKGCSFTTVIITLVIAAIVAIVAYYYLVYTKPKEIETIEVPAPPTPVTVPAARNSAENPPAVSAEPATDKSSVSLTEAEASAARAIAETNAEEALAQLSTLNLSFSDIPGLVSYGDNPDVSQQLRDRIHLMAQHHATAIEALHSPDLVTYLFAVKKAAASTHDDFPALSAYLLSRIASRQNGHLDYISEEELTKHFNHDKRCQTYR